MATRGEIGDWFGEVHSSVRLFIGPEVGVCVSYPKTGLPCNRPGHKRLAIPTPVRLVSAGLLRDLRGPLAVDLRPITDAVYLPWCGDRDCIEGINHIWNLDRQLERAGRPGPMRMARFRVERGFAVDRANR